MPRELYKENVAYLHKRDTRDNTPDWATDGEPFFCNRVSVKHTRWTPQSNTPIGTVEEIIKTTTQLNFEVNDKITFQRQSYNNANIGDFSMIGAVDPKPMNQMGNKHRNKTFYEYWITKAG